MPSNIYLLPMYANKANLKENRYETTHVSSVAYSSGGIKIELSETNSLVEDRYSLNLASARYIVEGSTTESREAMIHHHPKGHPERHLQFTLRSRNQVIRISLDMLDDEDYEKCIKGFIFISQEIISAEKEVYKIKQNLQDYFFNDKVMELEHEKDFLIAQVKRAYGKNKILDNANKPIKSKELAELREETHLLPFLEW